MSYEFQAGIPYVQQRFVFMSQHFEFVMGHTVADFIIHRDSMSPEATRIGAHIFVRAGADDS